MKLLTIGTGKASGIADLFASRGARVNQVNLFKTFALVGNLEDLNNLKNIDDKRRFYAVNRGENIDVRSAFNSILSFNELYEASMVIVDLEDDFSFYSGLEVAERLGEVTEEPRLCLAVAPEMDYAEKIAVALMRIKRLLKTFDYLFLFEKRDGYLDTLIKTFNVLSLVGEVDARKKMSGEVVVDTSDFLNSLSRNGISVAGMASEILSFKLIRRMIERRSSALIARRTERILNLLDNALKNISARAQLDDAEKALIVFSGDPDEVTMDGMFECIKTIEQMNPEILVRYGDYPVPNSREINLVTVFSGIKKFRL